MGSIPPEMSLDYRPTSTTAATAAATAESSFPGTISKLIAQVTTMGHVSERMLKLDDYVNRLEDEMRKIEAFKRELPLCMLLLSDGPSFTNFMLINKFLPSLMCIQFSNA